MHRSWQLLVVAGLGDPGDRRVVRQVGGCHRQGPRQCVAALKRGDAAPCHVGQATASDTGALGRDPQTLRGGTQTDFSKSFQIVSYLQSKGRSLSALASVGDPYRAPSGGTVTSVIVASSLTNAGEVGACVLKSAGASPGCPPPTPSLLHALIPIVRPSAVPYHPPFMFHLFSTYLLADYCSLSENELFFFFFNKRGLYNKPVVLHSVVSKSTSGDQSICLAGRPLAVPHQKFRFACSKSQVSEPSQLSNHNT